MISTEQMKSLLVLLNADSFEVPKSPAKSVTKNYPPKSLTRGLRESASDTESEEDTPSMSRRQQVVTVKCPTIDEAKALISQLRLQTVTQRPKVSEQLKNYSGGLLNSFTNLIVAIFPHFLNIISLIISQWLVIQMFLINLMNKQAQAATTKIKCVGIASCSVCAFRCVAKPAPHSNTHRKQP